MKRIRTPSMLSMLQAAGLLQRVMPHHDALEWLVNDRRHSPLIPYVQVGDDFVYLEDEVIQFAQRLSHHAVFRTHRCRRKQNERRQFDIDRRQIFDRRHKRKLAAQHNLDRRFAVRRDRRGDMDRRVRGWVDRRCAEERRD